MSVIILSLVVVLMGCNDNDIERNTELENALTSMISLVSDNSASETNMKDLINFEWDKAFLIKPYTSEAEIEKQIGVNFKDESNIGSRDDIYLLIFLNDDKVVQYAELTRQQCDFSLKEEEYLTPSNDLLYVIRY